MDSTPLGRSVPVPQRYAPEVLFPISRAAAREALGLLDSTPFSAGWDIWHAWEAGFRTRGGLPVVGVVKIAVPFDSPRIVESKSLKLYLNSLASERFGTGPEDGIQPFLDTIRTDLSAVTGAAVEAGWNIREEDDPAFPAFERLETMVGPAIMEESAPGQPLSIDPGSRSGQFRWSTDLLASRCPVTGQPDWGSLFVEAAGDRLPDPEQLLRYVVGLRSEEHYHEEICEQVYAAIDAACAPERLLVACIYTRRGGIDICPVRASEAGLLPERLGDVSRLTRKLLRQ